MEVPMPQHHPTSGASAPKRKRHRRTGGKRAGAQAKPPEAKPKLPTTESGLRAYMAEREAEYKEYQEKRSEGVPRSENPHREGYSEWKRAYKALLGMGKGLGGEKGARSPKKGS
jgi:hypothetical protein